MNQGGFGSRGGRGVLNDKGCRSIDWWTPPLVLEPVRAYFRALGHNGIELDPATDASNPTRACVFFTAERDGLSVVWGHERTSVFVNPPYGKAIRAWVAKIGSEAARGLRIVALLPGQRFEQGYWQRNLFTEHLTALVAVRKRIAFLRPDGTAQKGNPYGSFLYVYNGSWAEVVRHFSPLGMCLMPGRIAQQTGGTT